MRSSLLFFMLSVTVSAQPPPVRPDAPIQPELGGRCCAKEGVADPTLTCQKMGLNSFCCTGRRSFISRGCDGGTGNEAVGRHVQGFPPQNGACGFTAFIGCA
ncbi:hypothetical protein MGG_17205 [Pyricularia oryzae 70-15]|uniref:Uncharacterized protein n=4 Tax=Pyricularia oryzae TaxID=318829 RepID=G4N8H2_PYRO7|nr:uncharacterized protein MGG_17205 [Pyricularia oryzae 70-15]ELQ34700.1 hypothetical protein OOU_Y34scaffold00748g19 [Pyricularia oryzae Y34]KAI6263628.1 hypothetical protein MCOR19_000264 [Pyricularia oryzae]EHA51020.1 hypothetical protein MGG_17205 [Pyricularia oryzae 70-15]KAI6493916.1 hypothetical protein MCOR18_001311 [Pyricularia oryzae]KAI7921729.1 hypothetical protein M9X92_005254 [Pyricularia oryzae]